MDFSKQGGEMNPGTPGTPDLMGRQQQPQHSGFNHKAKKQESDWYNSKLFRSVQALLMLCVVIVIVGLLVFLAVGSSNQQSEGKYIQTNKLQAVFLNTGQVYFGNITALNNNYLILTNIFYLQTSSNGSSTASTSSNSNSSTNVTLVKLGCEIHAPLDQMMINKSSVTFWENLSPSGQVAKAVATWEKDNPNGQKCSDQSTAGTSGTSTPQNATDKTGS